MKTTGLVVLILLSLLVLSVNFNKSSNDKANEQDSVAAASIAVVGDLMCHSVQYNYARVKGDSFNFNPVYRYVKDIISSADIALGNFETVTAGSKTGYSGYPFFNSPDQFVSALKQTGFDLLTTSNNHSLDQKESGLRRTIKIITEEGMGYNGTFTSQEDRDSIRVYNINGITVSFLAYSYGTNGLPVPKGKNYLINLIDTILIRQDVQRAGEISDIVLVHYHFGEEYQRKQSKSQENLVRRTADYGADIVIGGHPHVIQPADFIEGNKNTADSIFVIYSMGNFISNQRKRYTDAGLILRLNLQKDLKTGEVSVKEIFYTPTWVFRGSTERGNEFIIIPDDGESYKNIPLNKEDLNKMEQAFGDTRSMLEPVIKKYTN
jgi:poly-gamma-glutamate capsule biosynthesis protein CapA/YwtB (metallophosphatase superfamily)